MPQQVRRRKRSESRKRRSEGAHDVYTHMEGAIKVIVPSKRKYRSKRILDSVSKDFPRWASNPPVVRAAYTNRQKGAKERKHRVRFYRRGEIHALGAEVTKPSIS